MKFNHKQYAQALHEALQDTNPKDHDAVIENFIEILKARGDLTEYEKIISAYEVYDREQRGITEVEITTAQGSTTVNKSLIDDLNKIVGNNIEVKEKVNSNLIGGVVIRAGDTLIDGSIKHHLDELHQTLTEKSNGN